MLILGASARAAAFSALRSGSIQPWCVDLFADADLQRVCTAQAIAPSAYPGGLLEAARQAPAGPWLYTGALENHPHLIDSIARERPLWGNPAPVVRRVRSPALVVEILRQADLPCPAVAETLLARHPSWDGLPIRPTNYPIQSDSKTWLIKPRQSAGGANIRWWRGQAIPRSCYAQEWIDGSPCSALFAGRHDDSAEFLGATRQLAGVAWLHAGAFRYCGNIGPLDLNSTIRTRLQRLGDVLAKAFSLRGFFGVDFIQKDDVPWPVEINPRYTAGVEVLERATGMCLFSFHREAFSGVRGTEYSVLSTQCSTGLCGKAILFAKEPLHFPAAGPWKESLHRSWPGPKGPDYADIPHPGCRIEKGHPVLTLFAHAAREADCLEILRDKALALDRQLFGGKN